MLNAFNIVIFALCVTKERILRDTLFKTIFIYFNNIGHMMNLVLMTFIFIKNLLFKIDTKLHEDHIKQKLFINKR